MPEPTINFKQGINGPYYSTIILLIVFFFLSLFLYFSYIIFTRKNEPLVVSSYDYDLYLNSQGNNGSGGPLSADNPEGYKNPEAPNINDLKKYEVYSQCSNRECVFDNNTGFKRCPEGDQELVYDIRSEQCVKKSQCPPLSEYPYAVNRDGEALTNSCESDNPACQCVANPQCANKVIANFITVNGSVYNADSQGYGFTISEPKNNFYDNLQVGGESGGYCKLNPSYTDKIINGCDFQNSIGDPMNCKQTQDIFTEITNVKLFFVGVVGYKTGYELIATDAGIEKLPYTYWTYDRDFFTGAEELLVQYSNTFIFNPRQQGYIFVQQPDNNLVMMRYSRIVNFASYSTRDVDSQAIISGAGDQAPVIPTIDGADTTSSNILVHIYGLEYYDNRNQVWVKGVHPRATYIFNSTVMTIPPVLLNICFPDDFGSNFKNMLNCVQSFNQPCTSGTLTYNLDKPNQKIRGTFCKASIIEGVQGRQDFTDSKYYLKDTSFYTTSCLAGKGCNKLIDKSLYTMINNEKNYSVAVKQRKSKMLPYFDCSAVSNLWFISKLENNFNNLTGKNITFNTSILELEKGDYWLEGRQGNITLTVKDPVPKNGTSIHTFENPWTLGVSIGNNIFGVSPLTGTATFTVTDIYPNDHHPTINGISISVPTSGIAKKHNITLYPAINDNSPFYGRVNLMGSDQFQISDFNKPSNIINNIQNITFFKQFGFNGINYNTYYDLKDKKRYYTPSYQNYQYFQLQQTPFSKNSVNSEFQVTPPLAISQLSYLNIRKDNPDNSVLNRQTFLDTSANFKIESSMYYPVWNDDKFQQECMFCQPSFVTFLEITQDNKINGAQIQFSSQDFRQYVFLNDNYYFSNFFQVKDGAGKDDLTSNTALIILDEYFGTNPNNNIYGVKIGDYVIDQKGYLDKNFVFIGDQYDTNASLKTPNAGINITPSTNNNYIVNYEVPDDRYIPFKLEGNQILDYTNVKLSSLQGNIYKFDQSVKLSDKANFYSGKYYVAAQPLVTNNGAPALFEIAPLVKITDIRTDPTNRLTYIYTDSVSNTILDPNSLVQFISQDEILNLTVSRNYESEAANPEKNNATIKVNGITDGRITDLKITDQGSNYFQANKPVLLITRYHDYVLGKRFI